MPQALKPLCLTQVGRIPFSYFQPSSLWGNKKCEPPVKRSRRWTLIFCDKICLTGCKWSNLNAPGTQIPVSYSLLVESLFSFSSPLSGIIRNWTPQYKDQDDGKCMDQNLLNRLQRAQFECPKYRNPCVSFIFWSTVGAPFSMHAGEKGPFQRCTLPPVHSTLPFLRRCEGRRGREKWLSRVKS